MKKEILITGASRGIGKENSKLLLQIEHRRNRKVGLQMGDSVIVR